MFTDSSLRGIYYEIPNLLKGNLEVYQKHFWDALPARSHLVRDLMQQAISWAEMISHIIRYNIILASAFSHSDRWTLAMTMTWQWHWPWQLYSPYPNNCEGEEDHISVFLSLQIYAAMNFLHIYAAINFLHIYACSSINFLHILPWQHFTREQL